MDTPLGEGTKRAIINAVITFVYTAFLTYQGLLKAGVGGSEQDRIRDAAIAGVIVALAPFVVQTVQGGMDQRRANNGIVQASDVPIAIAAEKSGRKPSAIARDFAPADLNKKAA